MYVERENFLKHRKTCAIKFNYIVDPFVLKSCSFLQVAKEILKGLKFGKDQRMNYDPRHIILKRKQSNNRGTFEH